MDRVQRARDHTSFPWPVNSGARCPEYNDKVSKTGRSGPHTKDAIDIGVSGAQAHEVILAFMLEKFTGLGIKQTGPRSERFVHGDALSNEEGQPRPFVWSY